jgi:hypothetical protein
MLSDPISILVATVATNLPRTGQGVGTSQFQDADGAHVVSVKQTKSAVGRFRREIRFTRNKVAADPISAVNKSVSASIYMVIDEPAYGFSDADLADMKAGLNAFTGDATIFLKLLGGEF